MCVCVVVAQGGIGALVTLAKSPNETSSMREALSQAMSNIAIVPSARGLMIQQGCLQRKEFFENNYFRKKNFCKQNYKLIVLEIHIFEIDSFNVFVEVFKQISVVLTFFF